MPTLLTLPRELRDEIIDLALFSGRALPQKPDAKLDSRIELYDCPSLDKWTANSVKHMSDHSAYSPNGLGLLLANRQLHHETTQRIKNPEMQSFWKFKIDIMVVEERELWPTWSCIPPKIVPTDTVEATFRIMGCSKSAKNSGFRLGCGGPPLITWGFYSILTRFLSLGPAAPLSGEYKERSMKIKNIKMNFITPECPAGLAIIPKGLPISRVKWESLIGDSRYSSNSLPDMSVQYIPSAESLAEFIHTHLGRLLLIYWESYGELLLKRVDNISLFVDGEFYELLDIVAVRAEKKA